MACNVERCTMRRRGNAISESQSHHKRKGLSLNICFTTEKRPSILWAAWSGVYAGTSWSLDDYAKTSFPPGTATAKALSVMATIE